MCLYRGEASKSQEKCDQKDGGDRCRKIINNNYSRRSGRVFGCSRRVRWFCRKYFFTRRKSAETKPSVARCRGLAVVVARSYHVVLRPVCVRVWPRKSCVATGGGGVDSRSRFPNPRIMVCPPPHPAQGPPPPDDRQRPPPFVTHRSVFILIYMRSNGG